MTIEVVASDVFTESSTGGPNPSVVSGSFTYPALNNGMAVLMTFAHDTAQTITAGVSTFDGNTTTQRALSIRNLGVGGVLCHINTFALGADSGGTVNVTATVTGGTSSTGVGLIVVVVKDCKQSSFITDTGNQNSVGSSSSVTGNSAATDLCLDIVSLASSTAISTPGVGQTQLENATDTGGDPISGASSSKAGTGSPVNFTWAFSTSNYTACCISLIEELPLSAVITSVTKDVAREPGIVNPTDTAVAVVGTDFDPGAVGPTTLYLADSSNFSTATKVAQTIANLTNTSLDWDVGLGTFPQGDLFLFVVTDEGEVGEIASPAFLVIVSIPDVHIEMRQVDTVASGGITENFDFDVKAVIGFVNGGNPDGTTIANSAYGFFFHVESGFDGGTCIGSTNGAAQYQREVNINTDGSINILPSGSGAAASKIFGRPSISGQDIDFTFSLTETGYSLNLLVIGGRTVKADAAYVQISAGSYSSAGFTPDVLFACTTGETKDTGGDTTFAVSSFGVAVGTVTADQWSMNNYHGSITASKNGALRTGFFCNQLNESSYTWGAALTAFTSNGVTWSGSNSDGMIILMVNTDTLGVFTATAQKPTTAITQVLPDFGFTPGGIILASCTRTDTSTSFRPTQRRSEMGFGFGDSLGNVTAMHAIDGVNGSVSDAEMSYNSSNVLIIPNRVSGPALSIETSATLDPIVDSTPSIVWDATGEASLIAIFGLEATIEVDNSEIFSQIFDV